MSSLKSMEPISGSKSPSAKERRKSRARVLLDPSNPLSQSFSSRSQSGLSDRKSSAPNAFSSGSGELEPCFPHFSGHMGMTGTALPPPTSSIDIMSPRFRSKIRQPCPVLEDSDYSPPEAAASPKGSSRKLTRNISSGSHRTNSPVSFSSSSPSSSSPNITSSPNTMSSLNSSSPTSSSSPSPLASPASSSPSSPRSPTSSPRSGAPFSPLSPRSSYPVVPKLPIPNIPLRPSDDIHQETISEPEDPALSSPPAEEKKKSRTSSVPTPRSFFRGVKSMFSSSSNSSVISSSIGNNRSSTGDFGNIAISSSDPSVGLPVGSSSSGSGSFWSGEGSFPSSIISSSSYQPPFPSSSSSSSWKASSSPTPSSPASSLSIFRLESFKSFRTQTKSTSNLPTEYRSNEEIFLCPPEPVEGPCATASCLTWSVVPLDFRAAWHNITCKGSPPGGRMHHTACVIDRYMYVFGGTNEDSVKNQMFVLDLESFTWAQLRVCGLTPCPRYGHSATVIGDQIFMFGGKSKEDILNDLCVFHPMTSTWYCLLPRSPYSTPRAYHMSHYFRDQLYIFGGLTHDRTTCNEISVFSLETKAWSSFKIKGWVGRAMATSISISGENKVVVIGGFIRTNGLFNSAKYNRSYVILDFNNKSCTKCYYGSDDYDGKLTNSGVSTLRNLIVCFGGRDKSLNPSNKLVLFNPCENEKHRIEIPTIAEPPPPVHGHSLIRYGDRFILFGGRDSNGLFSSESYVLQVGASATPSSQQSSINLAPTCKLYNFEDITFGNKISHGATGAVFKGLLEGKPVVIKKYFYGFEIPFEVEIGILSRLNHPNIVQILGAITNDPDNRCVILEYAEMGDLFNLFQKKVELLQTIRNAMAIDIARGIQHLHASNIVHRDLKSTNLLVVSLDPSQTTIKIMDFGDAELMEVMRIKRRISEDNRVGTVRWTAPEVLNGEDSTHKSDVYSFGIILWEIFTQRLPYENLKRDYEVEDSVREGGRPEIPDSCPLGLRHLILSCLARDPHARPTIDEALAILLDLKLQMLRRDSLSAAADYGSCFDEDEAQMTGKRDDGTLFDLEN